MSKPVKTYAHLKRLADAHKSVCINHPAYHVKHRRYHPAAFIINRSCVQVMNMLNDGMITEYKRKLPMTKTREFINTYGIYVDELDRGFCATHYSNGEFHQSGVLETKRAAVFAILDKLNIPHPPL